MRSLLVFSAGCLALLSTIEAVPATAVPPKDAYWPAELGAKFTPEEVRTFVHYATYTQNSQILTLEPKMAGGNVFPVLRKFVDTKVGLYFKDLLRMWAKFTPADRIKYKAEMFKNIDSLKIPDNWKVGLKGMFEHVDNLQSMIAGAVTLTSPSPEGSGVATPGADTLTVPPIN